MEPYETRHSLIRRACDPGDQRAWVEFVENYRRFICYILHEIGVGRDEVDDLAQQILVRLTRDLPTYDRSRARFRSWLGAVIRNAAFTHLRTLKRRSAHLSRYGEQLLAEGPDGASSELEEFIESEWKTYVSSLAMERVRSVFQGQAMEVFEMGLDGRSADEISEATGLSISSVYTLRKRVKKRLYLEIRALTAELEP
ncbi:DNA-directed RNA polymerase sigma-70 factor [Haloferula helveola]|uniref:DNA-directed RNA polymerase sigma-70 factor n=1 Tax=Haloferula helveola TaxID=490095 RepID=A0ABM7RMD9_9BACT|nr:DNA-directed RNA polymerase sigma-70 factor [Haloferula helveola]